MAETNSKLFFNFLQLFWFCLRAFLLLSVFESKSSPSTGPFHEIPLPKLLEQDVRFLGTRSSFIIGVMEAHSGLLLGRFIPHSAALVNYQVQRLIAAIWLATERRNSLGILLLFLFFLLLSLPFLAKETDTGTAGITKHSDLILPREALSRFAQVSLALHSNATGVFFCESLLFDANMTCIDNAPLSQQQRRDRDQ